MVFITKYSLQLFNGLEDTQAPILDSSMNKITVEAAQC